MAFSIDEDLLMKIRKGTTGEFIIEDLPQIFIGCTARLVIKKTPYTADLNAYVNKTTTITDNEGSGIINMKIAVSDSDNLIVPKDEEYASYVWGVLVEDGTGELAVNIIPENFEEMPECRVYPEIAGNN